MASNQDIKNALSFGANVFGLPGKTVGNAALLRVKAWFEADYAEELDGAEATADDFAAWLWRQIAPKVKNYERRVAEQAIVEPADLDE